MSGWGRGCVVADDDHGIALPLASSARRGEPMGLAMAGDQSSPTGLLPGADAGRDILVIVISRLHGQLFVAYFT
jgi:hypothetical protein